MQGARLARIIIRSKRNKIERRCFSSGLLSHSIERDRISASYSASTEDLRLALVVIFHWFASRLQDRLVERHTGKLPATTDSSLGTP